MSEKRSKESVDYSKGMSKSRCGLCQHYIGDGVCRLVAGQVSPWGWCKLFERKGAK